MGLAAVETELCLTVPTNNSGEGSFAPFGETGDGTGNPIETFQIPVGVGDEELAIDPRPVAFVKIDVEGFECEVLDGLTRTLRGHKPLVTTEVAPEHLARAGKTPEDLFSMMGGLGYESYSFLGCHKPLRYGLSQEPRHWCRRFDFSVECADVGNPPRDVLWVPTEGAAGRQAVPTEVSLSQSQSGMLSDSVCLTPESEPPRNESRDQEREYEQAEEHDGHVRAEELRPPYQGHSRDDQVDAQRDKDQPQAELDLAQHLPCA